MRFIFHWFIDGVVWLVDYVGTAMGKDMAHMDSNEKLNFVLAAFHSCFNVINASILIWFIPQIEKFVCWVIKPKKVDEEEDFRLHFITAGFMKTPELSVLEAQKEIQSFAERMQRMFGMVKELLNESSSTTGKKKGEKFDLPVVDGPSAEGEVKDIIPLSDRIREWMAVPAGLQI